MSKISIKKLGHHEKLKVERIYKTYKEEILHIAMKYLKDEAMAEDCRHEAMCKLSQNLDKFDPDTKAGKGYIYRTVANTAKDMLRKRKREIPVGLYEPVFERGKSRKIEELKGKYGLGESVDEYLEELDEIDREVLRYRIKEDLTYEEIAKNLNMSKAAVEKRGQRLRQKLKEIIQKKEGRDGSKDQRR